MTAPESVPAEPLDLAGVRPWLAVCGSCDGDLTTNCTHPQGDYRVPMLALYREVERLRSQVDGQAWADLQAEVGRLRAALDVAARVMDEAVRDCQTTTDEDRIRRDCYRLAAKTIRDAGTKP